MRFACLALPFALSIIACAYAEAFNGTKEPMFETGAGLFVGAFIGAILWRLTPLTATERWAMAFKAATAITVAFDVAAIPLARLMIRIAYSYPGHRIPW